MVINDFTALTNSEFVELVGMEFQRRFCFGGSVIIDVESGLVSSAIILPPAWKEGTIPTDNLPEQLVALAAYLYGGETKRVRVIGMEEGGVA